MYNLFRVFFLIFINLLVIKIEPVITNIIIAKFNIKSIAKLSKFENLYNF